MSLNRRLFLTLALAACTRLVTGASPAFSPERIRAHVTFLADDLLEGREAGTRGHEIAARYVAAHLATAGVRPLGVNGSYLQPVGFMESRLTGGPPSVTVRGTRGTHRFNQGDTAVIRGPLLGGSVHFSAPVVFAGYGVQDAASGIDDYAGLDVRGKVVVVLFGTASGMDSEIAAHLQSEQPRIAGAHGAVAMLAIQTRPNARAFAWRAIVSEGTAPFTTWIDPTGKPFDFTYGLKTGAIIRPDAAASLFDSSGRSLESVLSEAEHGRPKGFPLNITAEITASTATRRYTSPEVVGTIEGADPQLANQYVVLMAHVDHIGIRGEKNGDRINNGALDNAAGAATLIEVASALATSAERPRRSILVVGNTAEEKGLLGAEYLAHYPPVPASRLTAAIDLDMPMLLYDFTDVVPYGARHSTLEASFRRAGQSLNVAVSPDPMPEQAIFVRSDHYSFAKIGVPAVMLATGMANGGSSAWTSYFAHNYHQPSDDVSQPINWEAGAKFADLNYRAVLDLANSDVPPRWYEGDYFGNLFAPNAAKAPR